MRPVITRETLAVEVSYKRAGAIHATTRARTDVTYRVECPACHNVRTAATEANARRLRNEHRCHESSLP